MARALVPAAPGLIPALAPTCNEMRSSRGKATMFSVEHPSGIIVGLALCLGALCTQPLPLHAAEPEDTESYQIYTTVLQVLHSNVAAWTIMKDTRGFEFCATPARDQAAIYRPMLDDYNLKNKTAVPLEGRLGLSNYLLTGPQDGTGNTKPNDTAVFSAVGFNPERTRAAVCFWAVSNGTCSFLVKNDGAWQFDKAWRGDGCGWAF